MARKQTLEAKAEPRAKSAPGWVAGIDGGGTKTRAWVATADGELLGRGESGPSNCMAVGVPAAARALDEALRQALDEAGRAISDQDEAPPAALDVAQPRTEHRAAHRGQGERLEAICLGMAGADRPEERRELGEALARLGWPEVRLIWVNDAAIVLAAGRTEGAVAALVAGTGSIVYAETPEGQVVRVGGWGPIIGDEGSGYDLGRRALIAVMREADGRGPRTALTPRILEAMGVSDPFAIPSLVYRGGFDRPRIAALSRVVVEVAVQGDPVALAIARAGAADLAELVITALSQLSSGHEPGRVDKVVASGGLFANGSPMWKWVQEELDRRWNGPRCRLISLPVEPAVGAVLIAIEAVSGKQPGVFSRLTGSYRRRRSDAPAGGLESAEQ
ncbi:MAG TPA: hypothetical protein GXX55_05100 [Firmicutes bacterium]|nr:hypothetical protein [Bacillota bacterium]